MSYDFDEYEPTGSPCKRCAKWAVTFSLTKNSGMILLSALIILYGVPLCSSVKSPANPFSRMDFTGLFSCFAWQQEF
jgi:hypothetical protein